MKQRQEVCLLYINGCAFQIKGFGCCICICLCTCDVYLSEGVVTCNNVGRMENVYVRFVG